MCREEFIPVCISPHEENQIFDRKKFVRSQTFILNNLQFFQNFLSQLSFRIYNNNDRLEGKKIIPVAGQAVNLCLRRKPKQSLLIALAWPTLKQGKSDFTLGSPEDVSRIFERAPAARKI